MPKRKASEEAADYSDEDEETVTKKKTDNMKAVSKIENQVEKTDNKKAASKIESQVEKTDFKKEASKVESQVVCQLSSNQKVVVWKYKGRVFVDIREYYTGKNGEERLTAKGVALTLGQWDTLKEYLKDIQELIKSLG